MSFWKSRADRQDRYRRELLTGVIAACHPDGSYDVLLPAGGQPVRQVRNGSGVRYQPGNRVVLHRLAGRDTWQIQAAVGGAAPTTATASQAVLNPPPLVYWDPLPRTPDDPTTIAAYAATPRDIDGGTFHDQYRNTANADGGSFV